MMTRIMFGRLNGVWEYMFWFDEDGKIYDGNFKDEGQFYDAVELRTFG